MSVNTRVRIYLFCLSLAVLAGMGGGLAAVWQQQQPDFRPVQVVPAFPPITEFPVKSVQEAAGMLNPSELVLGVTVGKESRAYPINMLTGPQREILNDTLGGRSIMATW